MRERQIYKPIRVQKLFDFSVYVQDGLEYKKAEIVLEHMQKHIRLYLKHQRILFDKFMLEDGLTLQEIFSCIPDDKNI